MATDRNDGTSFRWAAVVLALSGVGLSPAAGADPAASLAERGARLTREPSGDVVEVRFEKPLAEGDLADLAKLPKLASLILCGPERDADLTALKNLPSLKSLQVTKTEAPDAGLRAIAGLTNLESLYWVHGGVTDDGLEELKPLTNLRRLSIFIGHQITDDGLAHLKSLPRLGTLYLSGTKITGSGLTHLHELKELELLCLTTAPITDEGLKGLAGLPQIRDLRLVGCRLVGDEGLQHIAVLSKLRRLELSSSAITSAGLKHLAGLSSLEYLSLGQTKVTDSGLANLVALDKLKTLDVHETNLTQEGVSQLKLKLPSLKRVSGMETLALKPATATPAAKERPETVPSAAGKRWAIISTDPKLAGLADLLTAALSSQPSVELVERQQIKTVLAELQLNASGLVDPDQAVRLGGLLKADALLLLEGIEQPGSPAIRLRLVEVRTAIKLLDVLLPPANVDRQLEGIVAELEQAGTKLTVPEDQRRYLGVLAIKSEEPGESLKSVCRTLTALVEGKLHQRPRFVVLEREQLRRLSEESNLTGAEQRLRSSAWLLEVGVRRRNGGGLVTTCRLLAPAQGARQTLRVEVASGELVEIRDRLIAEIESAVGLRQEKIAAADLADEATYFALRRDRLRDAYQLRECAEMAEAALILAPTPDNLRQALSAYYLIAHAADSRQKSSGALPAAHRYQELSLEWMRKTAPDNPMRQGLSDQPFEPHIRLPLNPESEEDSQLRAEMMQWSKKRMDLLLGEGESRPDRRLALLLHRLDHAAYFAETGREFAIELPRLVEQIERALSELGPQAATSERGGKFCQLLLKAVGTSQRYSARSGGRTEDHREWKREEVTGLWAQLAKHENVVVRMAGLMPLASEPGQEGERAAAEMMDRIGELPPPDFFGQEGYDGLALLALSKLPAGRTEEFLDGLIKATEQSRDPAPLLRYSRTVQGIVRRAESEQKQQSSKRILAALDQCPSLEAKDAAQRNGDRLQVTGAQMQAINVAALRRSLAQILADRGPMAAGAPLAGRAPPVGRTPLAGGAPMATRPNFSVAQGEGPWAEYAARPIEIAKSPENLALRSLGVDRHKDAKERGDELVLVWARKAGQVSVERVALGGGTPRKFGPNFPGKPRAFHGIQVASGKGAMFVASDTPGFVCLQADAVETIDEEQGAPASVVLQLAWWKDRLYVSYRDALASYDPSTKKFDVIASSLTVEPRNPLDGRGSFFVTALISDEVNACLWMHVQDNALPRARNGLWRYEPETKKFSQVTSDRVSWSWTEGGIFLNLSQEAPRWALLDRRDAQLKKFSGYRPWSPPLEARFTWPRVIKVGDHIITEAGQLYTPDGKVHQFKLDFPWEYFQRVGPGFLTHFDEQTNRLWYVERKGDKPAPADTTAGEEAKGD